MTVSITPVDVSSPGDGLGDDAYTAFSAINTNEAAIKAAIEAMQGRLWTVRNTTLSPLVMGARYMADNHAGITFTMPGTFAVSATAESDIWVANTDDASNVTLTPASGDAFFVDGATLGADTTKALTPGQLAMISPRTTDSEWDVLILNSGGGWADMTEAVWAGGTQSEVADSASAVAFDLDTDNAYSTAGANLLSLSNNGTAVLDFSFQGGIDHANSGASTAAHSQSLNLNWSSTSTKTSSGQYSTVIGSDNKANGGWATAIGYNCEAGAQGAVALGYINRVTSSAYDSAAFGSYAKVTNPCTLGIGAYYFTSSQPAQALISALTQSTTDATPAVMRARTQVGLVLPADTSWVFDAIVIGRSDETDGNDSAAYRIEGCISRDESSNTALVGSVTKTVIAESAGATAWDATAVANDTSEALDIQVTGEASTNIRWVAKVDIAEVNYA